MSPSGSPGYGLAPFASMKRRFDVHLLTCTAALLLAVLTVRLLHGFTAQFDLHTTDAASYLRDGLRLVDGEVSSRLLAWGPVSASLYGALFVVGVPLCALQDVAGYVVSVLSVLSLGWLLRPLIGWQPACLFAALWATTRMVLLREGDALPPPTYLLGASLAYLSAGAALRGWHVLGLPVALLAALERGEVAMVLFFGSMAFAWFARRRNGGRMALGYALLAVLVLCLQQLHEPLVARGWFAFTQHYAGELAARGDAVAGSGFLAPDATIARDFGDASSPLGALLANPGALVSHAWHNLCSWPRSVASVLRPFDSSSWLAGFSVAFLLGILLAACAPGVPGARRTRLWRLLRRRAPWLAALAAAMLAVLAYSLLLSPRSGLQLYVVPLVLLVLGCAWRVSFAGRQNWRMLIVLAALLLLAPRPYATFAPRDFEGRAQAWLLARHAWADGQTVCMPHAFQMIAYATGAKPIASRERNADGNADVVVLTPASPAALRSALATDEWLLLDYVHPVLLYARESVSLPARDLSIDLRAGCLAPSVACCAAALQHADPAVRRTGAQWLGVRGPTAVSCLPRLLAMLHDEDTACVERAIWAIGELGEASRRWVPQLLALPVAKSPMLRAALSVALGKICGGASVDAGVRQRLHEFAADPVLLVRQAARGALRILRDAN